MQKDLSLHWLLIKPPFFTPKIVENRPLFTSAEVIVYNTILINFLLTHLRYTENVCLFIFEVKRESHLLFHPTRCKYYLIIFMMYGFIFDGAIYCCTLQQFSLSIYPAAS
jgi:hypothetical protein